MIQWIYLAAVTAVIGVMVLLGFLICRKKSALNAKKKAAAMFALFLVFSVFSEFFVFNNKFFLTKGYTPVDMLAGSCTVEESDGAVLLSYTFDDPGIAVHNIYIDAGTLFDKKANQNQANKLAKDYTGDDEAVTVTVIAVDSANSKGITLPSRTGGIIRRAQPLYSPFADRQGELCHRKADLLRQIIYAGSHGVSSQSACAFDVLFYPHGSDLSGALPSLYLQALRHCLLS